MILKIDNYSNIINKISNQNYISNSEQSIKNDKIIYDNFDMSTFDLESIDYEKLTKSTLDILAKNYKNINIYISKYTNKNDIVNIASSLSKGKHLVISKEFIDKMGTSEDAYNKGKEIIEQSLKVLSSSSFESMYGIKSVGAAIGDESINFWIAHEKANIPLDDASAKSLQSDLLDPIKEVEKQGEELKRKLKTMKKSSNFKIPMDVYSKLANARNKSEVMSVVSIARSNIAKLRNLLRDNSESEKIKIRATIRQLEKAITRSYRKIKDLSNEENLSSERKKAKIKEKERLAQHKNEELNRRRAIRRIREKAQIDEANPLYYYPQMFLNRKEDEQESSIGAIEPLGLSTNINIDVTNVSMAGDQVSANVEVTIMPAIEIIM